jgi:Putative DNA-binding domain
MNSDFFDSLLLKVESDTLDFKSEQYRFVDSTAYEKSELLKDILAFANGWRECDAKILIGVAEKSPPPNEIVGITEHLKDNDLQQFVNQKTNRPVAFRVEAFAKDGKEFDVITIPVQQRPVFLIKDFGKLRQNITYIRRGTTCAEALPEEVIKMSLPARNLNIRINPTRRGKQQLAQIRLFNSGPGPIFIENWWLSWKSDGLKRSSVSVSAIQGRLPVRIEEQNTAELLVEVGDSMEDLTGIGVLDGEHHRWCLGDAELEVFKKL